MCNKLENGSEVFPIPENGFGWKIFSQINGHLRGFMFSNYEKEDGWINWAKYNVVDDGFCFFLEEPETTNVLKDILLSVPDFSELIVKKIEYRKGLGQRKELNFINGKSFNVALCKSFRIVEE